MNNMKLTDFEALTFDCYGTLIDWETGLYNSLQPLLQAGAVTLGRDEVLAVFARHEAAQEAATPRMIYSELLAEVHRRLAGEWGVKADEERAVAFGKSVPDWPEFPDTQASLQYLQRYYKLVILSNVDRASFRLSLPKLGVEFDAVLTAEEIGSYKPDRRNFHYMIEKLGEMGVPKERILHTAQSLFHDHVPAKELGLATAWINRRHGKTGTGATKVAAPVTPDFVANTLADFVAQHQALKRA